MKLHVFCKCFCACYTNTGKYTIDRLYIGGSFDIGKVRYMYYMYSYTWCGNFFQDSDKTVIWPVSC